jgi:hypothetical protein
MCKKNPQIITYEIIAVAKSFFFLSPSPQRGEGQGEGGEEVIFGSKKSPFDKGGLGRI